MAVVINLRRVRKQKARAEKDKDAAANRTKHGRTKAEKNQSAAESRQGAARLDQAKLTPKELPGLFGAADRSSPGTPPGICCPRQQPH
jgi:hypothetical protein